MLVASSNLPGGTQLCCPRSTGQSVTLQPRVPPRGHLLGPLATAARSIWFLSDASSFWGPHGAFAWQVGCDGFVGLFHL